MKKIDKKIIGLAVFGTVLILGGLGGYTLLSSKDKGKTNDKVDSGLTDNVVIQQVSTEKAESMYKELTEKCTGALVWNLKLGEEVEIKDLENSNACQNDGHYSKMIGYTYDKSSNVIIHVNVLKKENDQLFKLNGEKVADFSEEKLNDLLDYGTTYEYVYKKNGDNYKLSKVELMKLG